MGFSSSSLYAETQLAARVAPERTLTWSSSAARSVGGTTHRGSLYGLARRVGLRGWWVSCWQGRAVRERAVLVVCGPLLALVLVLAPERAQGVRQPLRIQAQGRRQGGTRVCGGEVRCAVREMEERGQIHPVRGLLRERAHHQTQRGRLGHRIHGAWRI